MNERSLEYAFMTFLTEEKGYPKSSFLVEAAVADKVGAAGRIKRYFADLILLDVDYNSYLALIEFKGYFRPVQEAAIEQVKMYLKVLDKPDLPAYLVTSASNEKLDFLIHVLDNNEWRQIEKDDFPRYDTLRSKNRADEKIDLIENSRKAEQELKKKRDVIKGTAYSSIASIVIAIVSMLVFSKTLFFSEPEEKNIPILCCDSIESKSNVIKKELLILKTEISNLKIKDSIILKNKDNIAINALNQRIKTLEEIINLTPDKLTKIQELNFEIKSLNNLISKEKEISELKIQNLKEKIDSVILWTSGIIITIFGSIVGFAINAFRKN